MPNVKDILDGINDEYGSKVAGEGIDWSEADRIPTGWFPLDLAIGGGFPMGGISVVYGPESSLKTSVALRVIAQCQMLKPQLKCVFLDLEGGYDPAWGEHLGVDNSKLVYALPDYAEQVVDIVISLLEADDIGVVVIDSLAAMAPENEIISSAEKASVGGSGLIISKFYRKLTTSINQAKRSGRYPLVIAINQIRHKIGVMYGNPETMPGGFAFKFASKMTVRLFGKDVEDKKLHASMAAFKEVQGQIKKHKIPITSNSFKFSMSSVAVPAKGLRLGSVDSWNTVSTYLKNYGWLTQEKSGKPWVYDEIEYKTLAALRKALATDPAFLHATESRIIKQAMEIDSIDGS
jgi:recombination protein RecA